MMMGGFALSVLALALIGAAASWVVGGMAYARCIRQMEGEVTPARWLSIAVWPFATKNVRDLGSQDAAIVSKAVLAFIVCTTVATATISLSTNYNRITK